MKIPNLPTNCNLLVVLGPTACGKTHFAVALAKAFDEAWRRRELPLPEGMTDPSNWKTDEMPLEIISADSRQVYKGMDIGTGKDLSEYLLLDGRQVPCHLVDICQAGAKYNVYEYQRDFVRVFGEIRSRGHFPVLCGGTGLYIEAVLKAYPLVSVPENPELRESLQDKTLPELEAILAEYKHRHQDELHNHTDTDTVKRAVRAIEIEDYYERNAGRLQQAVDTYPELYPCILGLDVDRELRRERISRRLRARLEEGMVDEVRALLEGGIQAEDLIYYGLEYKYLTLYLTQALTYEEMVSQLETAIHQFAKRQMTWFRGMEKRGTVIHWIHPDSL